MLAPLAHSVFSGRSVAHGHGKTDGTAGVGRFGSYLAEQETLLDSLTADVPVRTAPPLENKFDGNPSDRKPTGENTPNSTATNGNTSVEPAETETLPVPVIAPKYSFITKPSLIKDKKSAPEQQPDAKPLTDVTAPASPLVNPLIQKSIFEFGLSLRDHGDPTVQKEPEKTSTAQSVPGQGAAHAHAENFGHTPNQNELTASVAPSEANLRASVSGGMESRLDAGLKLEGDTQLSQGDEVNAQDAAKPQISKLGPGQSNQATQLAFASRIQDATFVNQSQANTAQQPPQAQPGDPRTDPSESVSPASGAKPLPDEEEHKSAPAKTETAQNPEATAYAYNSRDDFKAQVQEAPSAHATTHVEMPPVQAEPAKSGVQLKDVTFQVTQSNEKVEVRIVQQAGEVRVAVRSGDTDLVHGLQQNLSDLSGKLQQSGYHADTWRPGAAAETTSSGNDSRRGSDDSSNGQSQSQSQSGGSQHDRSQQNQNRSNRPRWVEEMESTLKTGDESTGVAYGFRS